MNKKVIAFFIFASFLFRPVFSIAGTSNTITYLKNQTQDAWTSQALVALGETNISSGHLTSVSGNLATDYAKTILAVAALGENPKTFGNIDYVAKLKTYYNNNQFGDKNLINDDMWSILAFSAVKENSTTEINASKNFIVSNQNQDGGWSYAVNGASDTNDTAATIVVLLESGVSKTDAVVEKALIYLKSTQNGDGGFGWQKDSNSDSGSDAWVLIALNKLGANLDEWKVDGKSPLDHLKTLEDSDGGYWWVSPGASDFNNKAMTPYAAISVVGKSFPVAYYGIEEQEEAGYSLRIEGSSSNICATKIEGESALDLIKNAKDKCGFTYVIENTSYGSYLKQINNDAAEGMKGWMYFVNGKSPLVGAADYILSDKDEVIFYYGEWGLLPIKISTAKTNYQSGEMLEIKALYYQNDSWSSLAGAKVVIGDAEYTTGSDGIVSAKLSDGVYDFFATKDGFVRSNKIQATVGSGVSRKISLSVEIEQAGVPDVSGEALIFEVSPDNLNFGKINPGKNNSQIVSLKNSGTVDLGLTAFVGGDSIFVDNTKINDKIWGEYKEDLLKGKNKQANVNLLVPVSYLGSGVKVGELIFWAKPK
jgi:hypothetical protein